MFASASAGSDSNRESFALDAGDEHTSADCSMKTLLDETLRADDGGKDGDNDEDDDNEDEDAEKLRYITQLRFPVDDLRFARQMLAA